MKDPRVLVIGGVDPTGRAGIARDVAVLESERVEPAVAVTALTVQDARAVTEVQPVSAGMLRQSLGAAASLGDLAGIKVGLVPTPELAEEVRRFVRGMDLPVVVDPVMRASTGEPLTQEPGHFLAGLLGEATLVTPNLDELEALEGPCPDLPSRVQAAQRLRALRGPKAVLVKGGHGIESPGVDVLVTSVVQAMPFDRLELSPPALGRGKGCELASRMAALLAKGLGVADAVRMAQRRLHERLQREVLLNGSQARQPDLGRYTGTLERLMAGMEPTCVPEVGMNLAFAAEGVEDPRGVIGLVGRITIAGGSFAVTGRPLPGGPHHTGRIAATAQRLTGRPVWVFNHRYEASLLSHEGNDHVMFRREEEPTTADSSMEWMTAAAIGRLQGLPSFISDRGMPGKEAMIRVLGVSPDELLEHHRCLHAGHSTVGSSAKSLETTPQTPSPPARR